VRQTSPGYDVAKDFSTIAQVGSAPLVLFVPASGAADLPLFLKQAHDRPVNIANAGPGSLGHLAAELLQLRTKTTLVSVPYRGSGPAMNETIAGQVDAIFTSTASGMPLVKSGRLRPLAVASPEPLKDFPEIPTFDRLGVQGVHVLNWWGLIAPAGLPADISARIAKAVTAAMRDPAIVERFAALGISPSTRDAAAFAGLMSKEFAAWRDVATRAGIKVD
jgi:tripartite-type tricarboxylate transporter receptor subunit TctC